MLARTLELFREHRAVRDFTMVGALIVFGGVVASHMIAVGLEKAPVEIATLAHGGTASGRATTHEEIRSVLDDNVTTGAIGARNIILDPCTGEQKMPPIPR